jgi:pilus assembly protein CpaE
MLALVAQRRGLRTALIDLDLQFGDIAYLAGKEERGHLRKIPLGELSRLSAGGVDTGELLIVEAPSQPEQAEVLLADIPSFLDCLTSAFDLVIANTGSFWSDLHAVLARRCSHLVFLMDQRSTSVNACRQAADLCIRLQVPQARFLYALNGCGRYAALGVQDVSLALGGADVCELADGGTLVDELLSLGCPKELAHSKNAFVASLDSLFEQLTVECLFVEGGRAVGRVGDGPRDGRRDGRRDARNAGDGSTDEARGFGRRLAGLGGLFSGLGRLGHVPS